MQSRNRHKDFHGNDLMANEQIFPVPLLAWAQPIGDTSFKMGFGFFAQGGMGVEYENFHLPFATTDGLESELDTLSSDVQYMKLTPTIAWQNHDGSARIGFGLNLGYAETQMRLFPNTSIAPTQQRPDSGFFGMEMEDSSAYSAAFRIGIQYHFDKLTIACAYLSATDHTFIDGTTRLNYSALGQGFEKYDTEIDGFNWPRQIGIGASYQITENMKIAMDVDWINWSDAVKSITFSLSQNHNPELPANIQFKYPMHWDDQWVWAFGVEYALSQTWVLRAGYNYAKSPVPAKHLLPYFPAIAEHHITAGVSYATRNWSIDVACEWALAKEVDSKNSLFCKHGFSEKMSQFTTHFMLSYRL
jgi:long-chain fatty acid transport protein